MMRIEKIWIENYNITTKSCNLWNEQGTAMQVHCSNCGPFNTQFLEPKVKAGQSQNRLSIHGKTRIASTIMSHVQTEGFMWLLSTPPASASWSLRVLKILKVYPDNCSGGLGVPILEIQIWLWGPRPLQNKEPTKNTDTCSLYKITVPNPLFLGALWWLWDPAASPKWRTWHEHTCEQSGDLE